MITLIADSGSTKTDWLLLEPGLTVRTQGLNPCLLSREAILDILRRELLPQITASEVGSVCFYGSGVRPEMEPVVEGLLCEVFPQASHTEAHSDMLGAARALCGRNSGIASILGTGANSCLYDGDRIAVNVPSLGFILGDEGGGASLGKRFLHALYRGRLSETIVNDFERESGLTLPTIINKVYREPMPNRFLASLSEFIHRHLDSEDVRAIVIGNFADFFTENIARYGRPELPVHFVGSIAWHYQAELREAAQHCGFTVGTILQSPLDGLAKHYHL